MNVTFQLMPFDHSILSSNAPLATIIHEVFVANMESQCTPDQRKLWMPDINAQKVVGTYAQTEMGHGWYLACSVIINFLLVNPNDSWIALVTGFQLIS